jgi:FtsP/CotA-like multicopper oxidase with cupredoxin domain
MHDLARHPMSAMSGLVLGVTSSDDAPSDRATVASPAPLRLFAQQARSDSGKRLRAYGFVLQRGAEPRPDSVDVPGTPLVLTRGETASITVINRLSRPTTVHWHGMELESVFDGVSGWSRSGTAMAPLVAPGDSFTVTFTPPRAGTFIYHTHIDEGPQLPSGMYGPLLVLEPGERWTPETDLTFMFGTAVVNDSLVLAVNGRREHRPRELALGTAYRLRLINIHPADPARMTMTADSVPLAWRPIAKDGAALPPALRAEGPSRLPRIGSGETYDFAFTPRQRGGITLLVETLGGSLRVPFVVR